MLVMFGRQMQLHYKNVLCWLKQALLAQKKKFEVQAYIVGKYAIAPLLGHREKPRPGIRKGKATGECKLTLYVA